VSALRCFLSGAAAALTIGLGATAFGAEDAVAREVGDAGSTLPRRIEISAGLRVLFASDPGLSPYMNGGAIPELATVVSLPILRAGPLSIAAVGEWDFGGRASTARGDTSQILVNRFGGGLEGRLALAPGLYAFGRASLSLSRVDGAIEDAGVMDRSLTASGWGWGFDATGGAGLLLAGGRTSPVHLWLVAEAGYAFAGPVKMNFSPSDEAEDPRTFGTVALPDVRLRGAIGSLSMALAW
jgi:hypothetical protein